MQMKTSNDVEPLNAAFLPREAMRSAVLPWHVVRPSVCPSVTLRYRDHIRSNSAIIISRLISLTISLSADPNMTDLPQREHPQILAGIGVVGKIVDFRHLSRFI